MTITRTATIAAILTAASAGAALADWPTDRPIEMIVAFAPGGGTDIMLRTMAPFLEAELETQFPVLNRPGASGEIAYTALSQARPDGYTVSSLNTPGFLTMQIERKLRFDPASICPIARIVEDPGTFIVQTGAEFQSLADLVTYAKANPGAVSVGTTGMGTDEHLAMLQLEQAAGIDLTKEKPLLLTISVTEDEIRGIGGENIEGAYACMKYFQSLKNPNNEAFVKAFKAIPALR